MSADQDPIRVAILQRVIAGYRIPVFNQIAKLDEVNLTVIHGTNPKGLPRGNTDVPDDIDFNNLVLPTTAFEFAGIHFVWLHGLISLVRENRFDVYIGPGAPTMLSIMAVFLYTRLTGHAKLIWWGRNLHLKREVGWTGRFLRRCSDYLRGPLYRSAECCVCYGTAAAEYFQSFGVSEDRTFIAYNSTNTVLQREVEHRCRKNPALLDTIRKRYGLDDRTTLTFAGTLTGEKRVDRLVDIHERLLKAGYDTTLLIAGDGPEFDDLREYAASVDYVRFTGWLNTEELAKILLTTDLFVMPGHGGLAVQEAMTLRNPVVTVPLDGTEHDLIHEGENGYIIPNDDDALFDAIVKILDEPLSVREQMGDHSRQIVEQTVNMDQMVDGFRRAIVYAEETPLTTFGGLKRAIGYST